MKCQEVQGDKEAPQMSRRKARVKAWPKESREPVVQIARTGNRRLAEVAAEFESSTDSVLRQWHSLKDGDAFGFGAASR